MSSSALPNIKTSSRSATTGRIYQILGFFLILIGVFLCFWSVVKMAYSSAWYVVLQFAGFYMSYQGSSLFNHGRKIRRSFANDAVPLNTSILYLRSFYDDSLTEKFSSPVDLFTEEEQLVLVFKKIGAVIAIGRPGESLPPIGATRLYVSDKEDWHQKVQEYIQRSQIVILRAGASPGLLWELTEVTRLAPPELLLIVIPSNLDLAKGFLSQLRGILKSDLPDPGLYPQKFSDSTVAGFIHFEKDWTPHFLPLHRAPWNRATAVKGLVPIFNYALQPFFLNLGLRVESRRAYEVYVLILLAVLVLAVVIFLLALPLLLR
jgi:hypothetical protein